MTVFISLAVIERQYTYYMYIYDADIFSFACTDIQ